MHDEPELAKYGVYFESLHRDREHTLSAAEERILAVTAPLAHDWQYDLHEELVTRTDFGTVTAGRRVLSVARDRQAISSSNDRSAREDGFHKRYSGYAAQRDLYAFTLLHLAASRNEIARLRHFEDDAARSYFGRYWTKTDVSGVLAQLAGHAGLHERYERLRAEHVKRTMGYDDVNIWDLTARPAGEAAPHYTIGEACSILLAATGPLGPEYHRELAALLDPANGRLDVAPGPNRRSGGFSRGTLDTDSLFFSNGFTGTYNDMRILMHESTHAVQRELMRRNHTLPPYASGPSYLAETYAIFNELLLADYLYRHASTPALRRFYLEQFFDGKGMVAFEVAPEAELEQTVYERVAAGTLHSAGELDLLTKNIYGKYSIWPAKHDELKSQWTIVPLMYEDPFYDVNYVYGSLIGLRLLESFTRDPAAFASHFAAALGRGSDAPPATLFSRNFGITLGAADFVDGAMRVLSKRLDDLQRDYGF